MSRSETRWVVTWAVAVMTVTCLPYLYLAVTAPPGSTFTGLLTNADDHCVYLAWEQQAAQGHFFMRDLFTNDPQSGRYISVFFWLIGSVARLTGLPLILAHHAARVLCGTLLLVLLYRLFALFTTDVTIRRAAFWFTALSSGLGWIWGKTTRARTEPADLWIPEATTFQCLYVVGLFCAALCLTLGILLLLLAAEGQRGRARWGRVAGAGLLGLVLGNVHSYDVVTLVAVWAAYLIARAIIERRFPGAMLLNSLVAALLALPSTLYQYHLYHIDPVFWIRAEVPTPSPPLTSFLLGYGWVLLLAIAGGVHLIQAARRSGEALGPRLLPLTWAVIGFGLPYLPLSFQRKLVMGLHVPLAFLAAVGAVTLARWVAGCGSRVVSRGSGQVGWGGRWAVGMVTAGIVLLTLPTNGWLIRQDVKLALQEKQTRSYLPAYLARTDIEAMRWAGAHIPRDEALLAAFDTGTFIPALAGRPVYAGHPSETPDAYKRLDEVCAFYTNADAPAAARHAFMEQRHLRYLYLGTTERQMGALRLENDPCFRPVYRNRGAAIFELRPAAGRLASAR